MEGIEPEIESSLGALGITEASMREILTGEQLATIVVKIGGLVAESAGDTLFGLVLVAFLLTDSERLLVMMPMTDAIPNHPYYPTKALMRGVDAALAAFERGEKVMVFGKSGRHRSAATSACILIGQGYEADDAIAPVQSKRSEADLNPAIRQRIERFEEEWRQRRNL